jgi:transcriptional regulator with XRE-family HTH domain
VSRLKTARLAKGLTQAELGRRVGVPQPTVHRAEASGHVPTAEHAARLYHAVGLDLDDLLSDLDARRVPREEVTTA